MKKLYYLIVAIVALALIVAGCGLLTVPPSEESELDNKAKPGGCATIQGGTIFTSDDQVITTGYDEWGYNYQAHMFNGYYCDSYRDAEWCQEWKDVGLMMKWNDAWLSNKDCGEQIGREGAFLEPFVPDGKLDRHFPYDTYIGSGAWLTNHQWGSYDFVDEFDIGDTDSEDGYELTGWSNPVAWTAGYGGGSDDKTFRLLLMGRGDCCVGCEDAYFTMNTNGAEADKLILHHLDGIQPDDFDVWLLDYIDEFLAEHYILIGSYDATPGDEDWVTTEYSFLPRSGELKFKLVATSPVGTWCLTWGQVAFSWAKLEGTCYWDYFVKIVAAPADAYKDAGVWYAADGTEIGPVIWGAFAIIQEVENDPCAGISGAQ